MNDLDGKKWGEVMSLAEKYGFLVKAYSGTAILATHDRQIETFGMEEYLKIQKMNGLEVKEVRE